MPGSTRSFGLSKASPRWWLVLVVLVATSAFLYARPPVDDRSVTVIDGETMGTTYRVVLADPVDHIASIHRRLDAKLDRINALMSTYIPDSELSRFNRHTQPTPFPIAEETREVITIAIEVWERSDGVFDATVGPLVDLWGFGPDGRPTETPSAQAVRDVLEYVGTDKLRLTDSGLVKSHPKLQLDLSAVAKGYAVDVLAEDLEARGFFNYLIEIGGEVRVLGEKRPGVPFRVGIEKPVAQTQTVHSVLGLRRGALATSGNYRNFYERDGTRIVHTLDPRTGRPVEHRLLSASVNHRSCAWADAWATALMASGDRAWALAEDNALQVLLLSASTHGEIEEQISSEMSALRLINQGEQS